MIHSLQDNKEANIQYQFDFDQVKGELMIMPIDLADDNSGGAAIHVSKHEFLKLMNAIRFTEYDNKGNGGMFELTSTIKDMLVEFEFTTPRLDGDDRIAYDAFALRVVELLESYKQDDVKCQSK